MQNTPDESEQAYREFIRVLEDAVRAGADSVEPEFEGRDLMVYFNFGTTGIGGAHIPEELQRSVIHEILKRARKSRGKIRLNLLGKVYTVTVKRRLSFDEWVYMLILKEGGAKRPAPRGGAK